MKKLYSLRFIPAVLSFIFISYVLITCINLVQIWADPFDDLRFFERSTADYCTTSTNVKHSSSQSKVKTILYWNAWSSNMGDQPLVKAGCPVTSCLFTSDLTMFNQSDVILFSVETLPDFILNRTPDQRFVFFVLESPITTASSLTLRNNRTRYNYFNWTMTYRRDSDIVLRDFMGAIVPKNQSKLTNQFPPRFHPRDSASAAHNKLSSIDSMGKYLSTRSFKIPKNRVDTFSHSYWFKSKNKMVAWFVSHCETPIEREEYARQLGQFVPVDYFGKCGKYNVECREDEGCKDNELLRRDYKFYLAFENSWCPDYVTEKFYRSFQFDVVPIVLGGAEYERFAPPNSYINALDFATPRLLADYLLLLNSSDSLYARYFDWKDDYKVSLPAMDGWCDLCRMAHDDNLPPKVYGDIKQWWEDGGECETDRKKYFK